MKTAGLSNAELLALRLSIETNPTYFNGPDSIFKFTGVARRKLDAIDREITHNLAMARAAAGDPVPCDGYSGRQTNRRR
jgi:hypothetical protein